jgi:heat shock protein HslJ
VRPVRRLGASVAAALLLLGGCAATAGSPPEVSGQWELVEFTVDGTVRPDPAGARATLTVSDGELGGSSFCNTYSGTYRLDGDELSVSGLGGTEMGCEPEVMEAEAAYLTALGAAERAAVADGYLVLTGPDAELRFRPQPEVPASDLSGTRWQLETLLQGDVASSTTGEPAVLELADDGTLTASTGCRDLTGSWALDGDVVRVSGVEAATGSCPPDVAAQDEQVTTVLSADFQVAVVEDSLTLTGRDGLGLVYRDAG